jgi:isoquinoline 1-oxidoreductase beta subunit
MRYATVVRPPMVGGVLESFDAAAALRVPGVTEVVRLSAGVAVVADDTWSAFRGAEALEIAWKPGGFDMDSEGISRRHARLAEAGGGAVARREGDVRAALSGAARRLEAVYEAPYLAHATMEPMNCTAHVRRDRCEVWAPTQNPQGAQAVAARISGLPVERVDVHVTYMGCGWGRRGRTDYVEDAVEASKGVGAPVQVVWTREEDMRQDQYRPATYNRFRGGLDGEGRLVALDMCVAAPPVGVGWSGAGEETGVDRNAVDGLANMPHRVPSLFIEYCRSDIPVPTGYWRSVGPSQNTFTLESFIDELAHAGGRDPLELRLEMLGHHPRMRRVLEKAAGMAGWGSPPPGGRARGIGLVENKGGIVAQVAEVSREGGRVRVHRVTCAADCGRIIHPGIVEAQIEGSVVAGLTAALYGRISFEEGRPVQSNFHDYRMLRMRDMPEIAVHIVDSAEEPGGVGEPAVPPIAPAVTNALFALTGERVRSLPLTA